MARHRIGVLDRRETPAATTDLGEEQARVRRRVEALERADNGTLVADGGAPLEGSSDSSVTGSSEATDEDVAAAIHTLEERGHRLLPAEYYER